MNPNKALWEKGDFTRLAAYMRASGEAFARSLNITPGMKVMDLGCGDGTTALPFARLGATVRGVDIASNLVEAGNKRVAAEGLTNITFEEGDACDLSGIPDDSFDLSVSVFGAMFAPKPFEVASEMVRVTKPGGRVVMGNWIPNDPTSFVSQVLKISSAFTPPPPEGFISPMLWGVEANILERFGKAGIPPERITMERDVFTFSTQETPAELIDTFKTYYGPTMNAFEAAEKNGKTEELQQQLIEMANAQNRGSGGTTSISASFMRVTVTV